MVSLMDCVLDEVERVGTNARYCTQHQRRRWRLDPVDVFVDAALNEVLHGRLKAHLQEWRARLLHTLAVKGSVVAAKRDEVRNQRQMSLVHCDAVHVEHCVNLL
jgi:hypothetical protein